MMQIEVGEQLIGANHRIYTVGKIYKGGIFACEGDKQKYRRNSDCAIPINSPNWVRSVTTLYKLTAERLDARGKAFRIAKAKRIVKAEIDRLQALIPLHNGELELEADAITARNEGQDNG